MIALPSLDAEYRCDILICFVVVFFFIDNQFIKYHYFLFVGRCEINLKLNNTDFAGFFLLVCLFNSL